MQNEDKIVDLLTECISKTDKIEKEFKEEILNFAKILTKTMLDKKN